MFDNDTFRLQVLGEDIQFPLEPDERLRLWDNTKNYILNFCKSMEEIADTLDGKPWFRPEIKKDVSADDFRAVYECFCVMADKLEHYIDRLRLEAEQFSYEKHCNFIRELGLEPITFEAFAWEQPCAFDIFCHPEWVAEFKQQEQISVDDTLHACAAFLLDWGQNRKKDEAGFWKYLLPSERMVG